MKLTTEEIQEKLNSIPPNFILAEHTETGHYYRHTPTNQLFASVTTKCGILDAPHLKKWAAKLAVEHMSAKITSEMIVPGNVIQLQTLQKEAILVHQDQFEEAGDIGTRGHKIIENYLLQWMKTKTRPEDIKTFIDDPDARCFAIARSAEMFCKDFEVYPIASEMYVASAKYRFAGTLDSLMLVANVLKKGNGTCDGQQSMIEGVKKEHTYWSASSHNPHLFLCKDCGRKIELEFSIVDWKTSNSIDKVEYAMQTAAYWQALYEMTGLRPKKIYVVRLDKAHAKYEVRVLANRSLSFKAFVNAAKIYDWLNDGHEKMVPAFPKEKVELSTILNGTKTDTGISFQEVRGSEDSD